MEVQSCFPIKSSNCTLITLGVFLVSSSYFPSLFPKVSYDIPIQLPNSRLATADKWQNRSKLFLDFVTGGRCPNNAVHLVYLGTGLDLIDSKLFYSTKKYWNCIHEAVQFGTIWQTDGKWTKKKYKNILQYVICLFCLESTMYIRH